MSMSQQQVSEKKSTTNVNQPQVSLYKPRQITMNQQQVSEKRITNKY